MMSFCGVFAVASAFGSPHLWAKEASSHRAPQRTTYCPPSSADWIKRAADYLNSKPASGKKPAIYAPVSLASVEPMNASVNKNAARTVVWYAFGEMTRYSFPGDPVLEGKFPLWINNGSSTAPFGGDSSTLGITIGGDGRATFH